MPDMLPGSGRFPRVIGLQIDYRRPPEGLPDASEPHRVDWGVGGVDPMAYRSTRAANDRRNGPTPGTSEATNMRRSADRAAISAGPSTEGVGNIIAFQVSTGSAHRVVFSRPYGIPWSIFCSAR